MLTSPARIAVFPFLFSHAAISSLTMPYSAFSTSTSQAMYTPAIHVSVSYRLAAAYRTSEFYPAGFQSSFLKRFFDSNISLTETYKCFSLKYCSYSSCTVSRCPVIVATIILAKSLYICSPHHQPPPLQSPPFPLVPSAVVWLNMIPACHPCMPRRLIHP